jgi:phage baseplate assembly protein W
MASLLTLTSPNWSLSLSEPYKAVEGIAAINQGIQIILETEKGSQPLMPDFGINISAFLGSPITSAAANLIRDIRFQIEKYEKRVKIRNITQQANVNGTYTINIFWEYNNILQSNTITI